MKNTKKKTENYRLSSWTTEGAKTLLQWCSFSSLICVLMRKTFPFLCLTDYIHDNNNNNVYLSCTHQRHECSHDMIHINLNIFYTHVEHSFHPNNPHKAPYRKTPPHTHTHMNKKHNQFKQIHCTLDGCNYK